MTSSTLAMAGTSRTIGHLYDSDGNRTRITHPDGSFFTYEYDGLGRFVRVRENGGDTLAISIYDGSGRLSRSGWAAAVDYSYDPVGRLQSLAHDLAGTGSDHVIGLGYNPAGQIRTRTGSNDSYAWTGSVAVDRPYTVNGQNQYIAAGPASFAYDPNGNLTSDGSTSFVYDVENRLVSASGAKTAALAYDPLGRLFQTSGGSAGVTRFLYDDDALIVEHDGAGTMVHRYVHGPAKGVDDPLVWYDSPAQGWRRALVSDQQGSIVAVADRDGNAIAINAYDEYGIPDARNQGRFQYTGQAWIPELGMYRYKARIYSPTLGRFLQTDPIGYEDQVNLYAYVGSDPINAADPEGKRMKGPGSVAERRKLEGFINAKAKGVYQFKGRQLERVGSSAAEGRSAYYSERLDAAIAASETIKLDISSTIRSKGATKDVDADFGGGVTQQRNERESDVTISGSSGMTARAADGGRLFSDPGDILAHELLSHAIPTLTGVDATTPLANENRYRHDIGDRMRTPDPLHPQ